MFVPTHDATKMVGDGIFDEIEVRLLSGNEEGHYLLHPTGIVEWNTCEEAIERIYIECPYCKSDIQQDERVECQCGWTAEAVSENQYNRIQDYCVNYLKRPLYENTTENYDVKHLMFWEANSIHWLEIQSGKERE